MGMASFDMPTPRTHVTFLQQSFSKEATSNALINCFLYLLSFISQTEYPNAELFRIAHQDAFQREEIERNKPLDAALKAYESELDNRKSRKRRHTQIHHPYRQSVEACLTPTKNGATPMAPGHSAKEEMKNKSK
jgi:hypothetical protein